MSKPFVSIIIPTYKDWGRLADCVRSFTHQSYPTEYFEVIVVNNADDDVPSDFVFPENCRIIRELKSGSYAARNTGILKSRGGILGFTDADCIPDGKWIQNAVEYLQEHPCCSRIAGRVRLFYRSSQLSRAELYEKVYAFNQDINVSRDGISVTANMFAYREVFEEIGLFNEQMISGGDFEWSIRAKRTGYSIGYAEDAVVMHPARFRLEDLVKKAKRVSVGAELLEEPRKVRLPSLLQFLYGLRPPVKSFRLVFSRGKDLDFLQKLTVMGVRYYLSLIKAYESYRLKARSEPPGF